MMKSLFIVMLLFLFGCVSTPNVPEQEYRGTYRYGSDVDVVSLCGSDDIYWVWSSPEIQNALNKDKISQMNQLFYVEFTGEFLNVQRDDLVGDYAGLVRINRVIDLLQPVPDTCQK